VTKIRSIVAGTGASSASQISATAQGMANNATLGQRDFRNDEDMLILRVVRASPHGGYRINAEEGFGLEGRGVSSDRPAARRHPRGRCLRAQKHPGPRA